MDTDGELHPDLSALSVRSHPFFAGLRNIAGFELPPATKKRFLDLHAAITATPRPRILARLTVEGGSRRDWLTPFTEAVLGYVQEGLAASYYHLGNVELIEREMASLSLRALPHIQLPQRSAIAGGNTRKVDFEYQAFVFAVRRTMEYLAVSVGAFFKCEAHRIRALTASIATGKPEEIRERVCHRIDQCLENLADVLPPDDRERSVRDQLAHWKAVSAGVFNVTHGPEGILIGIAGGGENLRLWDSEVGAKLTRQEEKGVAIMTLTPTLRGQILRLEDMIFGVYSDIGLLATS